MYCFITLKYYIIVAIVNILPYRKSLYDLPVPKYKNSNFPDFPNMKVDEAKIGIGKIGLATPQ